MDTLSRMERFLIARDLLVKEYLQGLLAPDVFDRLGVELADFYCSMVEQNEKEKGEK